jgi:hypothetical protein
MWQNEQFFLRKWYLDGISPEGELWIVYLARLFWRGKQVRYHHLLHYHPERGVEAQTKWGRKARLDWKEDQLRWTGKGFAASATWDDADNSLLVPLHLQENGALNWFCLLPRTSFCFYQDQQEPVRGRGYVERLELSFFPWEIPVRTLRWGRFHSANHHLTWIDWQGSRPQSWLFWNGEKCASNQLDDQEILIRQGAAKLTLQEEAVLREGPILSTLSRKLLELLPSLREVLPPDYLRSSECKWLSRGALRLPDGSTENGWAIHEKVHFGAPQTIPPVQTLPLIS